jgi:hypothetical protein
MMKKAVSSKKLIEGRLMLLVEIFQEGGDNNQGKYFLEGAFTVME